MYILPDMINMGLQDGEEWPSEDHKQVAMNICLGNPEITKRDQLEDVCGKIVKMTKEEVLKLVVDDVPRLFGVNMYS